MGVKHTFLTLMKTSFFVLKRELSTLFTHQYLLLVVDGESDTIQPINSVTVDSTWQQTVTKSQTHLSHTNEN